jgi:predicted DNA-binding protein with PD1-like motif
MKHLPLRLRPGEDLRRVLEDVVANEGCDAAFVLSGIGSLATTRLRFAGADDTLQIDGDVEILTLAGSISAAGSHLHISVADAAGAVKGGHAGYGCIVRTTAEVLIALLPEWHFAREVDKTTGYEELVVQAASPGAR